MSVNGKKIALCFLWSERSLIESTGALFRWLNEAIPMEFFVITNSYSGKILFLKQGCQAFTLTELLDNLPDQGASGKSKSELKALLEYDIAISHLSESKFGGESGLLQYADKVVRTFTTAVSEFRPDLGFVWNGHTFWQKALADVLHSNGRPCFFLERGYFPGTLVVDPEGVNYGSSFAGRRDRSCGPEEIDAEDLQRLKTFRTQFRNKGTSVVARGASMTTGAVRAHLGIPEGSRVVLLPLQIETDSNIFYYSPLYKTMPELVADVTQAVSSFPNLFLIVKPHPEGPGEALYEQHVGPNVKVCSDLTLHSLLQSSDIVITVNSTVGLEALMLQKPVVTVGNAIYSEKGFTHDVQKKEELPLKIEQALGASGLIQNCTTGTESFLVEILKQQQFSVQDDDLWSSRKTISKKIESFLAKDNDAPLEPSLLSLFSSNIHNNNKLRNVLEQGTCGKKLILFRLGFLKDIFSAVDNVEFVTSRAKLISLLFFHKEKIIIAEKGNTPLWLRFFLGLTSDKNTIFLS